MRRPVIAVIGLVALLVSTGCGPDDNPFTADPDAGWQGGSAYPHAASWGTLSGGMGNHVLNDVDPNAAGLQDGILVEFDDSMDPEDFTGSAFALESVYPDTAGVAFESIDYMEENRTAVLYGTFEFDRAYILTINAGTLTDLGGNGLDPNQNNLMDGSPWDDALGQFYNGSAPEPDLVNPVIVDALPYGGGINDQNTWITLNFEDGPMDLSYLTLEYIDLLRTSDSSQVAIHVVSATPTQLIVQPDAALDWGGRYTVRLLSSLRDDSGNLLDTNGDGYIWPDEQNRLWDFQLSDDGTTHNTPPTVAGVILDPDYEWLMIEFHEAITAEFVVMNSATMIAENIQLFDSEGMIPLEFEMHPAGNKVYCYFQRSTGGALDLWVSTNVMDEYGNNLDGNGDGLSGDDYLLTL
jgi:hypothetical protein